MKFFMEKNKDAGHRVTINIPKTTVNNSLLREFTKISKTTNINGFRKGKTPIKVIKEKYGNSVYYDIFKQLMQKFFYEFINKEKIKLIGSPKFYMHQNEDNKKEHFEYSVIYEIYPEFQIKNIKKIQVKKVNVKITDQDIKKNIEKYNTKKNIWNTVNKAIKSHDRVTINYCIYEKHKKINKFNIEKISFIVSQNTLIPQLNYKIINHFLNDIIFFKIKVHQFHPEKELQNKDITFKIKIIKIEKKQEIELENNSKQDFIEKKITQKHYQTIKNNLHSQINIITEKYLEDQIIQKIIEKNIILIPPLLFEEEIKILSQQYKKKYKEEKSNILEKKYHLDLSSQVKKKLYSQMIIEKIISDNQFLANENNIQKLIQEISLSYKRPIEIINLYNQNKNLKNAIKDIELKNQAMLFLKKSIQIEKKYWTFEEFINYNWTNYKV
ncbi:MAG: trigger factor [Buchnera aphidicola (Microlophium carnosum)]|uniref:Trigger factor n=1 Tax=Buchnera aphidicola (Microlophium carnosum) TaxID=2708354 RepID=A0A6G9JTE7_9GAMM|nr:MAG: trigger factor [Buchnera aphidicola (Microlophium carnosum)]